MINIVPQSPSFPNTHDQFSITPSCFLRVKGYSGYPYVQGQKILEREVPLIPNIKSFYVELNFG